jgi:DNA modification methylase
VVEPHGLEFRISVADARRCITVSRPGGRAVLDPFGGVGTTALAAVRLGHRAITIEISPAYTKEARQRLAAALGAFGGKLEVLISE